MRPGKALSQLNSAYPTPALGTCGARHASGVRAFMKPRTAEVNECYDHSYGSVCSILPNMDEDRHASTHAVRFSFFLRRRVSYHLYTSLLTHLSTAAGFGEAPPSLEDGASTVPERECGRERKGQSWAPFRAGTFLAS